MYIFIYLFTTSHIQYFCENKNKNKNKNISNNNIREIPFNII
eukprot:gene9597-6745_t